MTTIPQIFDIWLDPQERYDVFMSNYTEHTWTLVVFNEASPLRGQCRLGNWGGTATDGTCMSG